MYHVQYEYISRDVIYVCCGASLKDFQGRMTWLVDEDDVAYSVGRPRIKKTQKTLGSTVSISR